MKFYRHWHRETGEAIHPDGHKTPFSVWRWSDTSLNEAKTLAKQAAERIARRIRQGEPFPERYSYGERPLREEVLLEEKDREGNYLYVLTRNLYGSIVLNTAHTMFIDVDLESSAPTNLSFFEWLKLLFGKRDLRAEAEEERKAKLEAEKIAMARLEEWLTVRSDWGVRVYRTKAGLRYLVTHASFEPGGKEAEEIMIFLNCDVQYRKLCKIQESFRARLTPKPWRCGCVRPPASFPYQSGTEIQQMNEWIRNYERRSLEWGTCRFVKQLGNPALDKYTSTVVKLHDQMTRAEEELPLA